MSDARPAGLHVVHGILVVAAVLLVSPFILGALIGVVHGLWDTLFSKLEQPMDEDRRDGRRGCAIFILASGTLLLAVTMVMGVWWSARGDVAWASAGFVGALTLIAILRWFAFRIRDRGILPAKRNK